MLFKDKKGLSIMIGYVLLVVIAIVMSMVVYQWVRTYVPRDAIECPAGTSIFLEEVKYDCSASPKILETTVKNNGLFDLAGYFIHATTSPEEELATEDLSGMISSGGFSDSGNSVQFILGENGLVAVDDETTPDNIENKKTSIFDTIENLDGLRIEILPIRYQEDEDGRQRLASCSDAKVEQVIECAPSV